MRVTVSPMGIGVGKIVKIFGVVVVIGIGSAHFFLNKSVKAFRKR